METREEKYMKIALEKAKEALKSGDIPVGCIIVKGDEVISSGCNEREKLKNATSHAEIVAINEACERLGSWRLLDCEMYVTLEPCVMCSGAIINSRIPKIVVALKDPKGGALGSVLDVNSYPLNHKVEVKYGIMENESRELLQDFFKDKR